MMSSSISGKSTDNGHGNGTNVGGSPIVATGGALSFMGCVREASPSPHHYHHHPHHSLGMEDFGVQRTHNAIVKEPKKRRFHPLRGLRRIFRRKSRSAADSRMDIHVGEHNSEPIISNRGELTMKHPAGEAEEIRSKSASELLTDSCERQSVFLRRHGMDEPFSKLLGASGHLSVSHDSIFAGEVPYTRPLSSLNALTTLGRQGDVSDESIDNDCHNHGFHNHRISLGVLEQIKTAKGNRHHSASHASRECYQQETENYLSRGDKKARMKVMCEEETQWDTEQKWKPLQRDNVGEISLLSRAVLPEFESRGLNHTAAHHRISVRPKNRRPPRRTIPTITNITNNIPSLTIITISERADVLDSLEPATYHNETTPLESKNVAVVRKSAVQLTNSSEICEELETKLQEISESNASVSPDSLDSCVTRTIKDNCGVKNDGEMKCIIAETSDRLSNTSKDGLEILKKKIPRTSSIFNKNTKSTDSIVVNSFSKSSEGFDKLIENSELIPKLRGNSKYISKSTDGFDKLSEQLEVKSLPKIFASKSTETFDSFENPLDSMTKEKHIRLNPLFNINHNVSQFDSMRAADALLISDDSIGQRRSSMEFPSRSNIKVMSVSSENFGALEKSEQFKKRSSVMDIHLSSTPRHSKLINKLISKSSESFDTLAKVDHENRDENRKIRTLSEKIHSSTAIDMMSRNSNYNDGKRQSPMKKPFLSQRSSESSELGSTDTLRSYKRNKLFDSTDTIDSLDKDLDNDGKRDMYHKNDSGFIALPEGESNVCDTNHVNYENNSDSIGHTAALMPTDNYYWRQRSDSGENIDIHQLLAITIVSRMADNSNNQRNSVSFPKKNLASPSPSNVKQGRNNLLLNNLLVNKNNEELQNMLNGNISEVSTDTKSFKEKLIMFEKLGK